MILSYIDTVLSALYSGLSKYSLFAIPKSAGYGAVDAYTNEINVKRNLAAQKEPFRKLLEWQENQISNNF